MGRYRSRSRSPSPSRGRSRSYSPARRKRYDDPRDRRRDRHSPAPTGLLVRNISLSARPEELRVPFERFGPIKDVYLPKNYYTGEPRGFGFVKFRHPEDAAEAKHQLDRSVIGGREIRIVFAEENRKTPHEMRRISRPSGRGNYRRRSPSRSPRHHYRSYSRSHSPRRHSRRDYGARDDYLPHRSRSITRSFSPRGEGSYRSDERPPRRSRSASRSVSPFNEKNVRSKQSSREKARDEDYVPRRSHKAQNNSRSPSRSSSRSYSPR